jgi:hypothetical protein
METLMEPIYSYLYGKFSADISSESNIAYDAVLDDQALTKLLEQTIEIRFTQGVEQAYMVLRNPNRKFHASLDNGVLFQYYYLLATIQYERYDIEELEDAFRNCVTLFSQNQLEEEWLRKFSLLSVLKGTLEYGEDVLNKGWDWINLYNNEDRSLLFSLSIYFGSTAVHQENYEIAEKFLYSGLEMAESAHNEALVLGNFGALFFALDNFQSSIKYYKDAIEKIEQGKLNNSWSEKLQLMYFENLKNMELREAARKHEFFNPGTLLLKENDLEQAQRMRNIAKRYITNETYDENLRGRNGFRASNNLYEANRSFIKAERSYQLLGNVQGNKNLKEEKMKYFLNASKVVKSQILERIALEQAVTINDDKTIKGLLQDRIPFNTSEEIEEFCDWLFTSQKNRLVRLGRTQCLGYLADYIPEEYTKKAFNEIWSVLHGEWSFTKDFDFKRTAMKALGRLFPRLCNNDKKKVLENMWESLEQNNMLVKHQAAEMLVQIGDLSDYPNLDLHFLKLTNYIETASSQSREYSLIMKHFINISKNVPGNLKSQAANLLLKNWTDGNFDGINVFLSEHLVPYIEQEIIEEVVKKGIVEVSRELTLEPTNVYSMKAYEWGALLVYFLPLTASTSLFKEAEAILIKYITTENVDSSKRALVLKGIFYLMRNESDLPINHDKLAKACLECLTNTSTWDYTEPDPFSNNQYLLPELFSVLSNLDYPLKEVEKSIHHFVIDTLLLEGDSLSASLLAMSHLAKNLDSHSNLFIPIVSRLHMECKNDDYLVRAAAVHSLINLRSPVNQNETYWSYTLSAMEIALKDSYRVVRYQLAIEVTKLLNINLADNIKGRIINIHHALLSDLSDLVRKAAMGRKKVEE